jgi:hypothetical protein
VKERELPWLGGGGGGGGVGGGGLSMLPFCSALFNHVLFQYDVCVLYF